MSKQVIVFRKDLLKGDHAIRKGKFAAQVAHASLGALLKCFRKSNCIDQHDNHYWRFETEFTESSALGQWLLGPFTKIVVSVPDEASLIQLQTQCEDREIPNALITDAGNTEFHGTPTVTCLGIGPYPEEVINELTGELPLL